MKVKTMDKKLITTWDLSPLFKSDDDPKIIQNIKEVEFQINKFVKKWQKRSDYLNDQKILKQALDEYEKLFYSYGYSGNVGYYFTLRSAQETDNPNLKAKYNKAYEQANKNMNAIQFFELNLAKIDLKKQKQFLKDKNLAIYKHFLEKIFDNAKYLLTDSEEKILNLKSLPAHTAWTKMTQGFLSSEEREILTKSGKLEKKNFSEIVNMISDTDKKVRDSANKAFNSILEKYLKVATEEMNAIMADKKINDELRNFPRPDSSRLLSDDIDTKVIDALLNAISSRNDLSVKYYTLKAKLFGVQKLDYHERNVEYGKITKTYSFEEATELITKVMNSIDPKFAQIFTSFLKNGQVDIFPKKGKGGGAACWHNLPSQPSFVMLNYEGKLSDVIVVAHEFGHAINNELMREKQNALNFSTPTSTAEIASVFMEDFIIEEILKEVNDEEKLSILMSRLNEQTTTIFRQIGFYLFEKDLHKKFRNKGYLSSSEIGTVFEKNMKAYMGLSVAQPKWAKNWWVYVSHIRRFFYVYSYAGGQLIAMALQRQVRKDPKNIEGVKQLLSAGSSKSPKQILAELDIDITQKATWNQGLGEYEDLLNETEKLAKKLGKI